MSKLHFVEGVRLEEQECLRCGDDVDKGQRKENSPLASFQSLFRKVSECLRGEEVRAGAKEATGAQITRSLETVGHTVDLSGFLCAFSIFPAGELLFK